MSRLPQIYIVGGWVRDALGAILEEEKGLCDLDRMALLLRERGDFSQEIDLAGTATGEELDAALRAAGRGEARVVNERTGTYLIKTERGAYEYTPFRKERYAAGGAHTPVEVTRGARIEEDALRRDFRCNAVYFDPDRVALRDPLGGIEDIRARRLCAVDGDATLAHDGLRLLRLVRFCVTLGYRIEPATFESARRNAGLLGDIAAERRAEELCRTLRCDPARNVAAANLYQELNLLPYLCGCGAVVPDAIAVARAYPLIAFLADCAAFDEAKASEIARRLKLSNGERARLGAVCACRGIDPFALCRSCAALPDARELLLDTAGGMRRTALEGAFARFERLRTPYAPKDLAMTAAEISRLTGTEGAALGAAMQALWVRVVGEGVENNRANLVKLIREARV